jgi:hypothetical protein
VRNFQKSFLFYFQQSKIIRRYAGFTAFQQKRMLKTFSFEKDMKITYLCTFSYGSAWFASGSAVRYLPKKINWECLTIVWTWGIMCLVGKGRQTTAMPLKGQTGDAEPMSSVSDVHRWAKRIGRKKEIYLSPSCRLCRKQKKQNLRSKRKKTKTQPDDGTTR